MHHFVLAAISYNWIKDQTTPINSRLTPYLFISGDGQLYFSEVTRGDNGMYYCMATLTYPTDRDNYAGSFQSPSRISTGIPLQVQGSRKLNRHKALSKIPLQVHAACSLHDRKAQMKKKLVSQAKNLKEINLEWR